MPKRKRKKHYHTGTYTSIKTGEAYSFRSGWEELLMQHLDVEPSVKSWEYETITIQYISNKKTGKLRKYIPDFVVDYIDGHREILEVKPSRRVQQVKIQKKLKAGEQYCDAHGLTFKVITEHELKSLGLM